MAGTISVWNTRTASILIIFRKIAVMISRDVRPPGAKPANDSHCTRPLVRTVEHRLRLDKLIDGTSDDLSRRNTLCSCQRSHTLDLVLGQLDLGPNHVASTVDRIYIMMTRRDIRLPAIRNKALAVNGMRRGGK